VTGASGTAAGARRLHEEREEEEEADEQRTEEAAMPEEDHRLRSGAQQRRVTDVESPTALHARARVNRRRKLLEKAPVPLTTTDSFIAKASGQVVPTNCLTPEIQATLDLAVDAFYNATGFVANVSDLYGCQSQVCRMSSHGS
jgi:hypothetical protein